MRLSISLIGLCLACGLLKAQPGPFDLNEGLVLSHSIIENSDTPHHYSVDFWAKTGRTYVVEETEDLASGQWRRLPLLMVGNDSSRGLHYAFYGTQGKDYFQNAGANTLEFSASGEKQFVRLRYVDWLINPLQGDYDRDGVSNVNEVGDPNITDHTTYQTNPFGYPDEDITTDTDHDGLPDTWEFYRYGTLAHGPNDTDSSGRTYQQLYNAEKRDTDGDGLPDDWERFNCGGTLDEDASTVHDGKPNLARFREDHTKLAEQSYGGQIFRYDETREDNAFTNSPENAYKVFLKGNQGGSMIILYSDNTNTDITSVTVWPSNRFYGEPENLDDLAIHKATYTGSFVDGERVYAYNATPSSGDYVARDLLRSLHGKPLTRVTISGNQRLKFVSLAITSLPLTQASPTKFPIVLRDFPYGTETFPDFGEGFSIQSNFVDTTLDGGPTYSLPTANKNQLQLQNKSGHNFEAWFTLPNASGFNLPTAENTEGRQGFKFDDVFPHANDVGTALGDLENSFGFTIEAHFCLDYDLASTQLDLLYDDDLWVYIDGRLAVDRGGLHYKEGYHPTLSDIRSDVKARDGQETPFLEAQTGTCRVDIFYAERLTSHGALGFQTNGSMHPIYVYQVITDADLPTPVTYVLTQAPTGMTIDSHTGRILWDYWGINHDGNPSNDVASGSYTVTVSATDFRGYTATQTFTLTLQL